MGHKSYPIEFRNKIIELARLGRSHQELSAEFGPHSTTILKWVTQADRDQGRRCDGLKTEERDELRRLRRENKQLKLEREILAKATAWFARETKSIPSQGSN